MLYTLKKLVARMFSEPRSPQWSGLRAAFLAGKVCAACGGTKNLEAHHLMPFSFDPSRELDTTNLLPLCEDPHRLCHLRVGHSWNFSAFNPHAVEDAATELNRIKNRVERGSTP